MESFGTRYFPIAVQVVKPSVFGSNIEPVVRSIDDLAYSFTTQMIGRVSIRINPELIRSIYKIIHTTEIGSNPHVMIVIFKKAINRRIVQITQVTFRLLIVSH